MEVPPKSFIVALTQLSCPAEVEIERILSPGECVHFIRSLTYFQPSTVYSQALLGAADKADMTVCTPASKAEKNYPKIIIQAKFPNFQKISLSLEHLWHRNSNLRVCTWAETITGLSSALCLIPVLFLALPQTPWVMLDMSQLFVDCVSPQLHEDSFLHHKTYILLGIYNLV